MICFWRDVRTYNFIVRYLHVARHSCEEKNYCQKLKHLKIKMLFIFWSVRLYVAYTSTNACNVISKCIKRYIAVFFIEVLVVMHYWQCCNAILIQWNTGDDFYPTHLKYLAIDVASNAVFFRFHFSQIQKMYLKFGAFEFYFVV